MAREKGMGNLQREKSGRWTMRVGISGKRYCRSTHTKDREQAERILQRFLAPLGLGVRRLPLADVWHEYVKSPHRNELAPTTLNAKRAIWMHFARWMEKDYLPIKDLAGITADMIAEYLACLRVNVSATTYNNQVCVLREIFRILADKAGLEDDPWAGVRLRPDDSHSRRELTTNEIQRLLSAAKAYDQTYIAAPCTGDKRDSPNADEWHTLFLIGIYTGLRLGDCCTIDWSSIHLPQGIIQLIPSKTRRHAHGRPITIPIHPVLGQALVRRPMTNAIPSGPVLPSICKLYRHSRAAISDRTSTIFHKANIVTSVRLEGRRHLTPEATFHSLRHTFVSLAANAGVPLHVVQSIVGHESTAMTRHYYHESVDSLRQAINAIPTFT